LTLAAALGLALANSGCSSEHTPPIAGPKAAFAAGDLVLSSSLGRARFPFFGADGTDAALALHVGWMLGL
jgi:hypothetical protein